MKFFSSQLTYFITNKRTKKNISSLLKSLAIVVSLILVYGLLFHVIMEWEGQNHSWMTGFYWTLVTMSTLGFGDITFSSDIGRLFSMVVLGSGILVLLIMLPFTFIEFFYAPWMEAQSRARAPKELPADTKNHVIITHFDPISKALIEKLDQYQKNYVLLVEDLQAGLDLFDDGYKVMVGEADDPETYKKLQIHQASMVVANGTDMFNTNVAHTVREFNKDIKIVTTANSHDSVDILKLAGADHVLHMGNLLGRALSRRTLGQDARVHTIGRLGNLIIAEATAHHTPLVGQTLRDSQLREKLGINIVGIWERGKFLGSHPDIVFNEHSVLMMAGSVSQLRNYDELFGIYGISDEPVIIIGGGRVGRAAAYHLKRRNMNFKIIDKNPARIKSDNFILGDANDLNTLKKAGIDTAHTVIITTSEDDINVYLTIYCRHLRPDLQIVARSSVERNVHSLHRAGADFVLSYASMGANAIYNIYEENDIIMIAEGLNVFSLNTPAKIAGKTLIESNIRHKTGCSLIAYTLNGEQIINPDPNQPIPKNSDLILIGETEAELKFIEIFGDR